MAMYHARPIALTLLLLLPLREAAAEAGSITLRPVYTTAPGGLKTAAPSVKRNMPRLGLALSGGGAKAAAAIGVLKVLAQEGIPIAAIAGTSMGAGVGGFHAAGYTPEEIEDIFLENDWNDIFTNTPGRAFQTQQQKESAGRHLFEITFHRGRILPPSGLSAGQKLIHLLATKTIAASFEADQDFDRLRIPFRAVATDIETGDAVVIGKGQLHDAMRASAAIPLVFQPVELQGRMLVDGGLANNLPVDVVRSMNVDVVIAVDASSNLEKREQLNSLVEIMVQTMSLQIRRESERQSAQADLVITPDTSEYSFTDFPAMRAIIARGEEAARAALPRIRAILRPKTGVPADATRYRITSLAVRGNAAISEATVRYAMAPVLFPREAAHDEILSALGDVFRLGHFADVSLELSREGEGYHALLTVEENPVVERIEFSGNTLSSSTELQAMLFWQYNKPMNSAKIASELEGLVEAWRGRGYLLMRVERAGMKPDGKTLEIALYEGRVDSIRIAGRVKTRESLIRKESRTRIGQPLNFNVAAADIQHLYALDYFESLSVDMTHSPQGGIDLAIKVREKPTTKIRFGFRYDLGDRFTGLTDAVVDNVGGSGIKAFLNTRFGNYTDLALGYNSPVLFNTDFVHSLQGFFRERTYSLFEDNRRIRELLISRTGAEFTFGYQWFHFGDTHLRYRYETDRTEDVVHILPGEIIRIGSIALMSTVDTRDANVFPNSGILFKGSYDMAKTELGSTASFGKTSLFLQGIVPLAERHTVVLETSGGLGSGEIPYQEQFGIGGGSYLIAMPLLGYQRREFTGNNELGISAAYRWKVREYQLKAVKAVYTNVVLQAGNTWENRRDVALNDLRNGVGIGMHADTLIGPVKFDFGVGEQKRYTVYFSAGFDY